MAFTLSKANCPAFLLALLFLLSFQMVVGQEQQAPIFVQNPFKSNVLDQLEWLDQEQKLFNGNLVWDVAANRLVAEGQFQFLSYHTMINLGKRLLPSSNLLLTIGGFSNNFNFAYFDVLSGEKKRSQQLTLPKMAPTSEYVIQPGNIGEGYAIITELNYTPRENSKRWDHIIDLHQDTPRVLGTYESALRSIGIKYYLHPRAAILFRMEAFEEGGMKLEALSLPEMKRISSVAIPKTETFYLDYINKIHFCKTTPINIIDRKNSGVFAWNYQTGEIVLQYPQETKLFAISNDGAYLALLEDRPQPNDQAYNYYTLPDVKILELASGKFTQVYHWNLFKAHTKNPSPKQVLEDRFFSSLREELVAVGTDPRIQLSFSPDNRYLLVLGRRFGNPMLRVIDLLNKEVISQTLLPFDENDTFEQGAVSQALGSWVVPINIESSNLMLYARIDLAPPFSVTYLEQKEGDDQFAADPKAYLNRLPWAGLQLVSTNLTGKYVAGLYQNGTIKVWDGKTTKLVHTLEVGGESVVSYFWRMCFSAGGTYLCVFPSSASGMLQIWDMETGAKVLRQTSERKIIEVNFSKDDKLLILVFEDNTSEVYDISGSMKIDSGERLAMLEKYNGDELASYYFGYPFTGDVKFSYLPYSELTCTLKCSRLQQAWVLTTNDGRFSATAEDLSLLYRVVDGEAQPLNESDDQFVKGFLYEAVNTVKEDHAVASRRNYALLFAAQDYKNGWKSLNNPIYDTEALAKVLEERFGFVVEVVKNPNRQDIYQKLREYHQKAYGKYDQLLVFFSGHGQRDMDYLNEGYIVPVDASGSTADLSSCITHRDLLKQLDRIPCPHTLLVVDACYSGQLAQLGTDRKRKEGIDRSGFQYVEKSDNQYIQQKLSSPSRLYLVSGEEAVTDGKPGTHSPFTQALLSALHKNRKEALFFSFGVMVEEMKAQAVSPTSYGNFGAGTDNGLFLLNQVTKK